MKVYGYCPLCQGKGIFRERGFNGDDKCENGHTYSSSKSIPEPLQKSDEKESV